MAEDFPHKEQQMESLETNPKGGLYHISRKLHIYFLTCHNFFSLSSVQIIIIPACCLLCVL